MHSAYNRLNAIFTYSLTVLVVAALLSHITSFAIKEEPTNIKLRMHDFQYLYELCTMHDSPSGVQNPTEDICQLVTLLTSLLTSLQVCHFLVICSLADLRPVWTWNTKQLFVYITAEYANDQDVSSCSLKLTFIER